MKRSFQILVLFLTTVALGQDTVSSKEEQIKDLISNSFQEIFSDLDARALDVYCTEDFLLLETGEVWDMEKMRNYLRSAGKQDTEVKRINSFDFIEVKISGNMAWVAYFNKAEFRKDGEVMKEMNWVESATALLTEEGWKLQLLHSTVAKK
ncbi:protein of unknown function [Salinimicrobium catena]|uniref:DUF4440 domain-containing protein n=1 Tax=Salinimicrobium catena TaxID=390640 RepID=A0A1H5P931_9FLAO|nr:nuclear transport factor 2 family protein [Salinimicrobium catena]SDL70476.1 protein of unknown function [Salinimicrobium catena]SEF09497.1 protein of unknown function [Salinimicrobium catena]